MKQEYQKLYTAEGEQLQEPFWNAYPRPQMRREKWQSLNGVWDLSIAGGEPVQIRVPYAPESLLSGFEGTIHYGDLLKYERTFTVPEEWRGQRVILHFGAVNRLSEVRVNGKYFCRHENGYLPFSADVTEALKPWENTLTVTVINDLSTIYPWGKQKEKRGGMWYTPVSGIWQTVWMEPVPEAHIERLEIGQDQFGADLKVIGVSEGTVFFDGKEIPLENGEARLTPKKAHPWTPEDPFLYPVKIRTAEDEVESYVALRSIAAWTIDGVPRLMLNGKPYFFNGLLDQGYYSDGLYTPADPGAYERDILAMKSLGFNMLRKHIKVEPEQFYYDCDRLGMAVFQDMVNCGKYNFFHDTVLPTLGFKTLKDQRTNRDPETRETFLQTAEETIRHLKNHPSIVYYTIFNEGWGQFEADEAYQKLKAIDPSRIFDAASGWFRQGKSDVESEHIYFKKLKLGKASARPAVLSEFGGYVYKDPDHSFNLRKTYGYKIFSSREAFVAALRKLYLEELLPLVRKGCSAAVYTQVSDVEDETNGFFTYDRKVLKVLPEEMAGIAEALRQAVSKQEEENP